MSPGQDASSRRRLAFIGKALTALDRELGREGSRLRRAVVRVPLQPFDQDRQRDMYAPRLEAVRLVLRDLLEHLDPVTLCVGRSPTGEHYGRRVDRLAELAGIDQRRAERALHDIHSAGLVASHRRAEEVSPGEFRGRTSVRQLALELFLLLGLAPMLERTRRRLYQARKALTQLADYATRQLAERGRKWREARQGEARSLTQILDRLKPPRPA